MLSACLLGLLAGTCRIGSGADAPPQGPFSLLDALTIAMKNNSAVHIARDDADASRARVGAALGAFDLRYTAVTRQAHTYQPLTNYEHNLAFAAGVNTFEQSLNATLLSGQGEKQFQNGIELTPSFTLSRLADNLENIGGENRTNINIRMLFPILRGRGRSIVTAPVRAAKLELEGSLLEVNGAAANAIFQTASCYWDYLLAELRYKVRLDARRRADELAESVALLIQADRLSASEIHQPRAAIEQEQARLLEAAQQIIEARQNLAYAIGVDAMDAITLADATDNFPEPALDGSWTDISADPRPFVQQSLLRRHDYLATNYRIQVAQVEANIAADDVRSRLDLTLETGYNGLRPGLRPDQFIASTLDRIQGPNAQGSLTYTFNPSNGTARGNLQIAQESVRHERDVQTDLGRRIAGDVITSLNALTASRGAVLRAANAAGEFRQALEGENTRLEAGVSVVPDVITAEGRLTEAELQSLEAHRAYAVALARLRYVTGTLLGTDTQHPSIEVSSFFAPPERP